MLVNTSFNEITCKVIVVCRRNFKFCGHDFGYNITFLMIIRILLLKFVFIFIIVNCKCYSYYVIGSYYLHTSW